MKDKSHEGTSQAILHEFVQKELPLIQRALAEVEAGKTLTSGEVEVLFEHLETVKDWYAVSWEIPEYNSLLAKVIESYNDIATLAIQNENQSKNEEKDRGNDDF